MTTIAYDGKTLAVDSQGTSSGIISTLDEQKLFLDVGDYKAVAFCGQTAAYRKVVKWIKDGLDEESAPKGDWCAICLKENGELIQYSDDLPYEQSCEAPFANGSGFAIAIGAMKAGADAKQAIEIAKESCIYTGGKVQACGLNQEMGGVAFHGQVENIPEHNTFQLKSNEVVVSRNNTTTPRVDNE